MLNIQELSEQVYEQNGEIDDEVVLDQDDKNKNRYVNIQKDARSTLKIELTLNTIINYIHSATLSTSWKKVDSYGRSYKEGSIDITLKRD